MDNEKRYQIYCVPEKLNLLTFLIMLTGPFFFYKGVLYWFQFTGFFIPENSDNWIYMIDRIFYTTDLETFNIYLGLDENKIVYDKKGERNDTDIDWYRIIQVDEEMKKHPTHTKILEEIKGS